MASVCYGGRADFCPSRKEKDLCSSASCHACVPLLSDDLVPAGSVVSLCDCVGACGCVCDVVCVRLCARARVCACVCVCMCVCVWVCLFGWSVGQLL